MVKYYRGGCMADNRLRIIVNFKNNILEKQLYDYINEQKIEGKSSYVKKLIYKDMKEKGLIK